MRRNLKRMHYRLNKKRSEQEIALNERKGGKRMAGHVGTVSENG